MRMRATERYLIPILAAILVLTSGMVVGCAQKRSTAKLETYLEESLPIIKRHVETTEIGNQANRTFLAAVSSGNQVKVIKELTNYVDTLDWALGRTDSVLLDFKKLTPPPEARTFHSLVIESLIKEQAGLGDMLSYYSSVLRYGFGDDKALDNANTLMLEAQKIWLQSQYELQDLMQKPE